MSHSKSLKLIIVCCIIFCVHAIAAWRLPKDVEMLEGHEPPPAWIQDSGWSSNDNRARNSNGFVKAIRNRRATYRIKAIPSNEDKATSERHLEKREALPNMDVSAQYMEQLAISQTDSRDKREIIEEETVKGNNENKDIIDITVAPEAREWIPQPSIKDEEENNLPNEAPSTYNNAEPLLDRQNGREARGATKDQWVKLPYMGRPLENDQLSTSVSSPDEINHRMPRVNFVTQNKGLQTSESRHQRESIPRSTYANSDLRTDIYPPGRDGRGRSLDYTSYSRQSFYYPDDYRRRGYYDDLDYYDDFYYNQRGRDPYYDRYDYRNARRYDYNDYRYKPYDKYDDYYGGYDNSRYDKPRRIIYYANLPDVIRTPPSVYRYPQSRYDDDRYYRDNRDNRYDGYRNGYYYSRYPYSALKKSENEGPRDLSTSGTANKEKSAEALKRQQEQQKKNNEERARDAKLNSHQYPVSLSTNMNVNDNAKVPHQTLYHDVTRMDSDYHRYDHPSFQAAVDDPYVSRHD